MFIEHRFHSCASFLHGMLETMHFFKQKRLCASKSWDTTM